MWRHLDVLYPHLQNPNRLLLFLARIPARSVKLTRPAGLEEARICNLFKLRAARLCFAHAWRWKQDVTATGARGDTLRYWTRSDLWPAKWKHGSDLVMNRWNAKSYKRTTQMRSFGRLIVQAYTRSQMRIFLRPFRKVNRSDESRRRKKSDNNQALWCWPTVHDSTLRRSYCIGQTALSCVWSD